MEPLKHILTALTFIVLLFVIFTQGAEPSFGCKIEKPARPASSFEQLRSELLELDMSNFERSLSPYKIWLIRFWRGQYVLLLDVDSFIGALDSWKQRGSEASADFSELYHDSQYLYFIDLAALIQNTDLSL